MQGKYKVITLCGSTKFKDEFIKVQKDLTLQGYIVISVGLFGHSGDDEVWTEGTKEMLDDMHKRKIDMADEIFVVNVNGYIGSSTKSEIEYALSIGKKVNYLVPVETSLTEDEEILLIAKTIKPMYCKKTEAECELCTKACFVSCQAEIMYNAGCRVVPIANQIINDFEKSNIQTVKEKYLNKQKRKIRF